MIRETNSRRAGRELAFLAITSIVIWVCLTPFFREPGIPLSHEGLSYLQRIATYADHFRQGDFFPIWASHDAYGMGSPQPLFYHKTFYFLSAFLSILLGSVQSSVSVSLALFMLLGAYGMRLASGKLTGNFILQASASQALLLTNYSFTDWLVRGAMAEFSAFMLVPWLAWWCLTLIKDRRFSFSITPILYLMVQSHNVTALFGMIAILIAAAIFLLRERMYGMRRIWWRALASMAVFWLLLAPQLVAQSMMLSDYDPGKITQNGYTASGGFLPPARYFWDNQYVWLSDWLGFTVQIDFGIWIVALLILVGVAVRLALVRADRFEPVRGQRWELAFLACSFLAFLALQFRFSSVVYESLPAFQFLQFPWRLLVYITVLGLLLVVAGMELVVKQQRWLAVVGMAWAASFMVFSPLPHRFAYPVLAQEHVDRLLLQRDPALTGTVLQGLGEYRPRMRNAKGDELSSLEVLDAYREMYEEGRQLQVLSGSCQLRRLYSEGGPEVLERRFAYRCLSDSVVALPVSYSRLMRVQAGPTRKRLAYHRLPDDPRAHVRLKPGQGTLTVRLPSAATLAQSVLERLSGS